MNKISSLFKYRLSYNLKIIFSFIYWEIIIPLWWTPPKLVFGNTIGYRRNIIPIIKILLNKRNYKNRISVENQKLIKKLNEDGYLRLKKVDPFKIKLIKDQYFKSFKDNSKTYSLFNGAQTLIKDPLKNIPAINLILEDLKPLLLDMSLGSYYIRQPTAGRNYHLEAIDYRDAGISNAFHNDGISCRDKTIFLLLSENVTKETGATKFINKKESKKLSRDIRYFSRRFLTNGFIKKIYEKTEYFEGSIGDMYILSTSQCLHGATIPKKKGSYRDCIMFVYGEDIPPKGLDFVHYN